MRKHDWLWAACIAGVVFCSCSDDSKKTDTETEVQAVCGNSIVESPEVCDDGNEVDGDGCAGDCSKIESGFTCPPGGGACTKETGPNIPGPDPTVPGCGNGVIDEGEQCDDGNAFSFDGCMADCQLESGYECLVPGEPCEPVEIGNDVCGDGKVRGFEVCDDGNTDPDDGCDPFCQVEYGWNCDKTECHTVCGDGIIVGKETCDDGNEVDGDGCTADCQTEPGYECTVPGEPCVSIEIEDDVCGDGKVSGSEVCDDGNTDPDDGCDQSCMVEYGWTCDETGCRAVCGDGMIVGKETCDDGNEMDGDGCKGDCSGFEEGFDCVEEMGTTYCKAQYCGNGVIDDGEECDDGNAFTFDGCTADCQIEPGYECTVPGELCVSIEIEDDVCGDGKVSGSEVCDDGNTDSNDGCDQSCMVEYGWTCDKTGCHAVCGDGIIVGKETCDDGNNVDGDGCKKDCSGFEEGFDCVEEMGTTYCKPQYCGSGIVNEGEDCDYGEESADETSKSYGWNSELGVPYCFLCKFTPFCGDGIVNSGEDCDEGSLDEDGKPVLKDTEGNPIGGLGTYGGCKADCTFAAHCGDGIVQDEEVCDEGIVDAIGKPVGGDGSYGHCNADCSGYPNGFCGDGLLDKGYEHCDLGGYETNEDGTLKLDDKGNPIPRFVDDYGYIVGGDGSYGGCNADCTKTAFCGDGNIDLEYGELCDEGIRQGADTYIGGLGGYDQCKADCSGIAEFCGDGIVNGTEECDPEDPVTKDGCLATCKKEII